MQLRQRGVGTSGWISCPYRAWAKSKLISPAPKCCREKFNRPESVRDSQIKEVRWSAAHATGAMHACKPLLGGSGMFCSLPIVALHPKAATDIGIAVLFLWRQDQFTCTA
ncbi:unnamed protein product [Symbiodinium natans]|uniref:Uncharacterized protein n=1 Tax=Symbiodinium natans TaxID=878477 RepID=A0A812JB92_9DINO|nr:unnamed protein product [Symbiodinium natans]